MSVSVAGRKVFAEMIVRSPTGCPIRALHGTLAETASNQSKRFVCGCYPDPDMTAIYAEPERQARRAEAKALLRRYDLIAHGWTPADATVDELEALRLPKWATS